MQLTLGLLVALIVPAMVAPPARVAEAAREVFTATVAPVSIHPVTVTDKADKSTLPGGLACSSPSRGADAGSVSGPAVVGFTNAVILDSTGTGVAQDCRVTTVAESRVVFDMSPFQKHPIAKDSKVTAFLSYTEERVAWSTTMPRGSQGNTCVNDGFVAVSELITSEASNFEEFPYFDVGEEIYRRAPGQDRPPLNSDPWDLGEVARGWIESNENFGVVFTGFNYDLGQGDGLDCLSRLTNIQLQVVVVWEVPEQKSVELQARDLVIKDKTGAQGCVTGVISVHVTVRNAGTVPSGPPNPLLKIDGDGVEQIYASGILAGQSKVYTFSDVELTAGKHTIEVVVDPEGTIAESSESNNVIRGEVTCTVGAPEKVVVPAGIQITKFELVKTAAKPGCVAGAGNDFHIVVKNPGDSDVGDTLRVQLTVNGTANGSASIGGVGAKSEKDSYVSNANLPAGNNTIAVRVSGGAFTAASGEGANSQSIRVNCARG